MKMTTITNWNDKTPYRVSDKDFHKVQEDETGTLYEASGPDWGQIIPVRQGPELEVQPVTQKECFAFIDKHHRQLDKPVGWLWGSSIWTLEGHYISYTPNESREHDREDQLLKLGIPREVWSDAKLAHQYGPDSPGIPGERMVKKHNYSYPSDEPCIWDQMSLLFLSQKFEGKIFKDAPLCCGTVSKFFYKEQMVGVATVGRPSARMLNNQRIAEVTRVCVLDGYPNACSQLYSTSAKIAKLQGYKQVITYTEREQDGASVKAAGWKEIQLERPSPNKKRRKTDLQTAKWRTRWELDLIS